MGTAHDKLLGLKYGRAPHLNSLAYCPMSLLNQRSLGMDLRMYVSCHAQSRAFWCENKFNLEGITLQTAPRAALEPM